MSARIPYQVKRLRIILFKAHMTQRLAFQTNYIRELTILPKTTQTSLTPTVLIPIIIRLLTIPTIKHLTSLAISRIQLFTPIHHTTTHFTRLIRYRHILYIILISHMFWYHRLPQLLYRKSNLTPSKTILRQSLILLLFFLCSNTLTQHLFQTYDTLF
jgi:hypothetical protein